MSAIQSVAFFCYPVKDMTRARHFYEAVLGLSLESDFGGEWLEYDLAGTTFAITTTDMGHQPGAKGAVAAFEVDDLDDFVHRLKAHQVRLVLEITETPVCRMAVVSDPDGNDLVIHQRKT
jgi:predicted enzyme related to lactoylglutathione lyase